jgi:hypothetical protein
MEQKRSYRTYPKEFKEEAVLSQRRHWPFLIYLSPYAITCFLYVSASALLLSIVCKSILEK